MAVKIPPAAAARHVTSTEGTNLKIAVKIRMDSSKLPTAITAAKVHEGSPKAFAKVPAKAVIAVDRTSDTSSKKAAAKTRLNEKSLVLMKDQIPPACSG